MVIMEVPYDDALFPKVGDSPGMQGNYTVDGRKPASVEMDSVSLLLVMSQASQVVQDVFHPHEVAEIPWLDHDCNLFLNGWKSGEVFWPGTTGYLGQKLFKAFPNSHFDCEQESLHFPLCFETVRWKSLDPLIFGVQNPGVSGKTRTMLHHLHISLVSSSSRSLAPLVWPRFGPLAEVLRK